MEDQTWLIDWGGGDLEWGTNWFLSLKRERERWSKHTVVNISYSIRVRAYTMYMYI